MSGILLKSKGEDLIEDEDLLKMEDEDDYLGDLLNDEDVDMLISDPCNY
jgi:hypothetical protein